MPAYAELAAASAFSFLEGASHPQELVDQALYLGHAALGIADRNTVAGVVRAHVAAKQGGLRLLVGSRLGFEDGPDVIAYPRDREGWGRLCRLLSLGKGRAAKGGCRLRLDDLEDHAAGMALIVMPPPWPDAAFAASLDRISGFGAPVWLGAARRYAPDDAARLEALAALAGRRRRLVAVNDVLYHAPSRRPLQDVMRCIRHGCTIAEAGLRLEPHGERYLKPADEMARLFRGHEAAIAAQAEILDAVGFKLGDIRYEYPDEPVPPGRTPDAHLADLAWAGAAIRYPGGVPVAIAATIRRELDLIARLGYARYFLTVNDIVGFARRQGILCQGRGSAANSAVCYALGITAVNPAEIDLLFERFVSAERGEPPDIDVDFEHERREEVIQYIYGRYGRARAAIAATVIHYRPRSAIRDVGKALDQAPELVERLARNVHWWDGRRIAPERLREAGLDPEDLGVRQWMALVRQLLGFPRHLSQHSGGFVLTDDALHDLVPVENAAMPGRTVIEWDKDDLDAMGMLKVDILALGMLTALAKSLRLISEGRGEAFELQRIPAEDPATYDMLCAADSVGVFQVESRAQQNMLPRLRPRCFYDLVIEVAIVRPGPIQGGMVHPYLRRRQGLEEVRYPSPQLRQALQRTLGVPVFQEQVMQISMLAAGFSPGQADGLRRAMAAWRRKGSLQLWRQRLVDGMLERGYDRAFAEQIYAQIQGFSEYGFPESHAASFALLVYASAWIKCHHPAEFLAAMLNSQPLGFYTPSQLVQDAQRHGVRVLPPDACASDWDCTLEHGAVRLGLRLLRGLSRQAAQRLARARREADFADVQDLARRAALGAADMRLLAAADALRSLAGHRRQQVWQAAAVHALPPLLRAAAAEEPRLELLAPPEGEEVVFDHAALGLSLRSHPLRLLRARLGARWLRAGQLAALPDGVRTRTVGLVTLRQQPETARGTTFVSLEDETGVVQVICWNSLRQRQRQVLLHARLLGVSGRWQSDGRVGSLLAERLFDLTPLLGHLRTEVRSFR